MTAQTRSSDNTSEVSDLVKQKRKDFVKTAPQLVKDASLSQRVQWCMNVRRKLEVTKWPETEWVMAIEPLLFPALAKTLENTMEWSDVVTKVIGWKLTTLPRREIFHQISSLRQKPGMSPSNVVSQMEELVECYEWLLATEDVTVREEDKIDFLLNALNQERKDYYEMQLQREPELTYERLCAMLSNDYRTDGYVESTLMAISSTKPSSKAKLPKRKIPKGYCFRGCGELWTKGHQCNEAFYQAWKSENGSRA